jgi:hypothetical protein
VCFSVVIILCAHVYLAITSRCGGARKAQTFARHYLRQSCVKLIIYTMSYSEEKNRTAYSIQPVSSNAPFPNKSRNSGFESLADFEKKDLASHSKMELEFKFEPLQRI